MSLAPLTDLQNTWLKELGVDTELLFQQAPPVVSVPASPKISRPVTASPLPKLPSQAQINQANVAPQTVNSSGSNLEGLAAEISACQSCARHLSGAKNSDVSVGSYKALFIVDIWHPQDASFTQKQKLLQGIAFALNLDWNTQVAVIPVLRCLDADESSPEQLKLDAKVCSAWFNEQLSLAAPMAILAFGGLPASQLIGEQALKRGKMYLIERAKASTPCMATLPLSHLLTHPLDKAKLWQDLLLFKDLII